MANNKVFSDVQFWILVTGVAGIVATSYYTVMSDRRDARAFEVEIGEKFESVMQRARSADVPDIDDLYWALDLSNKQCEYFGVADNGIRLQRLAWQTVPTDTTDLNANMPVLRLLFDSMNSVAEHGCTSADIRNHQEVPLSRDLYFLPSSADPLVDPADDRFQAVWRYATDERYQISLVQMSDLPTNQRREPDVSRVPLDYPVFRVRRTDGARYPALMMSDLFERLLTIHGGTEMCFITDCHGRHQTCNNCFTNAEGDFPAAN
ncbi:MAG: hypothetical protein AAGA26_00015 [Pseudomonadota bacterium]